MVAAGFRMGRLDHVHLRVPDRAAAAEWYGRNLGFEPVERFAFWAEGLEGGPLQISADGGATALALFEARGSHPMVHGVAFSVDVESFIAFARSLPGEIAGVDGGLLVADDVIDFDLCWAFEFVDPWGNHFELNCYGYDAIRAQLVDADGVRADRKWPAELMSSWRARRGV